MSTEDILTILHKRLDLIEYAEKLLDLGEPLEEERRNELYRVVRSLRRLRRKLIDYVETTELSSESSTLLEYYALISARAEKEIVSRIALALDDPSKTKEFTKDLDEVDLLSSMIKDKMGAG